MCTPVALYGQVCHPSTYGGVKHKTDAGVRDKYKRLISLFVFTVHFLHLAALQLTVPKRQKKKPYFQCGMKKMLSQVQ